MAAAAAAVAVAPCAVIGQLSSLPRLHLHLHLHSMRAPNQIAAVIPSSSKARNWRSLIVASAAPGAIEKHDSSTGTALEQQPRRSPSALSSSRLIDPLSPVRTMRQMLEAMDRVFEDMMAFPGMRRSRSSSTSARDIWAPWDIMEDEKEVRMRFDMPGLSKEEVKVMVEDDVLVIQGKHKTDEKGNDGDSQGKTTEKDMWWKKRSYSSYDIRLMLPDYCDKSKVTAELKNGVLLVTIPKIPGTREVITVDVEG
ncbi:small heat shock protein, chloroplastic-like [Ananas comosus]|uniref:Small heat shock protein, chloroplastic-like n=3 Tax=Ananas comosus TaxID=4615 RepID=A0A6P5EFG8_ANACO|nr:small heat shock protein, chloroplastic-like [Ananas comosus]CAD1835602.1 unnamed protein product [Ananas comosus var. bracteatus]